MGFDKDRPSKSEMQGDVGVVGLLLCCEATHEFYYSVIIYFSATFSFLKNFETRSYRYRIKCNSSFN
ncbi:MAG: hypothetical protein ACI9J3_000583 [Parvicellaceae bacterium]|jgi:hypothetical protein